ncbi:MAG TPA: hypothetical protein VHW06_00035 [Streptosporangiaceae bacterium]|jgi:hypothetical protein|nr:hypothetical protein [Streptosporangiaceae bacterium]
MSTGAVIVIVVIIVVVIAALAIGAFEMRRRRLRQQFGPEYDRLVSETGNRRKAEAELADRQRRVSKLDIRPLSQEENARYQGEWNAIQERFVDTPAQSVTEAGTLVTTVMRVRGYPAGDQDEAMDALSVDHAPTLARYREARAISGRSGDGGATTDDLRNAMLHYRELFHELVEVRGDGRAPDTEAVATPDATDAAPAGAPAASDPAATAVPAAEPPMAEAPPEPVTPDAPAEPAGDAASPQRSTRG